MLALVLLVCIYMSNPQLRMKLTKYVCVHICIVHLFFFLSRNPDTSQYMSAHARIKIEF